MGHGVCQLWTRSWILRRDKRSISSTLVIITNYYYKRVLTRKRNDALIAASHTSAQNTGKIASSREIVFGFAALYCTSF